MSSTKASTSSPDHVLDATEFEQDPYYEAIHLWLLHILNDSSWSSFRTRRGRLEGSVSAPAAEQEKKNETALQGLDFGSAKTIATKNQANSQVVLNSGWVSTTGSSQEAANETSDDDMIDGDSLISSCLQEQTFWSIRLLETLFLNDHNHRHDANNMDHSKGRSERHRLGQDWADLIKIAVDEYRQLKGSARKLEGRGEAQTNDGRMERGGAAPGEAAPAPAPAAPLAPVDADAEVAVEKMDIDDVTGVVQGSYVDDDDNRRLGQRKEVDESGNNDLGLGDSSSRLEQGRHGEEEDDEMDSGDDTVDRDDENDDQIGWRRWKGPWVPRPIGVV